MRTDEEEELTAESPTGDGRPFIICCGSTGVILELLLKESISLRDKQLSFAMISSSSEVLQEEGSEEEHPLEERGLPDGCGGSVICDNALIRTEAAASTVIPLDFEVGVFVATVDDAVVNASSSKLPLLLPHRKDDDDDKEELTGRGSAGITWSAAVVNIFDNRSMYTKRWVSPKEIAARAESTFANVTKANFFCSPVTLSLGIYTSVTKPNCEK